VVVNTPWQSGAIRKLACSYRSFASSIITSEELTNDKLLCNVSSVIKQEMKSISSEQHNSLLRNTKEGFVSFNWDAVWVELLTMMPTLMKLLSTLVSDVEDNKILLCVIASMLLKNRCGKMCLVQKTVSLFLYGNGCGKQVFECLQPLMVCLTHSGTMKVIEKLSEDFDSSVHLWSHKLLQSWSGESRQSHPVMYVGDTEDDFDADYIVDPQEMPNVNDDSDEGLGSNNGDIEDFEMMTNDANEEDVIAQINSLCASTSQNEIIEVDKPKERSWFGFKIVTDNVDKNYRRTYQQIDYQTISKHYSYAVLDRVDVSHLSDEPRSSAIDVSILLPSDDDNSNLRNIFTILISR
jgi:L1 cell adhesion molecule like protein